EPKSATIPAPSHVQHSAALAARLVRPASVNRRRWGTVGLPSSGPGGAHIHQMNGRAQYRSVGGIDRFAMPAVALSLIELDQAALVVRRDNFLPAVAVDIGDDHAMETKLPAGIKRFPLPGLRFVIEPVNIEARR